MTSISFNVASSDHKNMKVTFRKMKAFRSSNGDIELVRSVNCTIAYGRDVFSGASFCSSSEPSFVTEWGMSLAFYRAMIDMWNTLHKPIGHKDFGTKTRDIGRFQAFLNDVSPIPNSNVESVMNDYACLRDAHRVVIEYIKRTQEDEADFGVPEGG